MNDTSENVDPPVRRRVVAIVGRPNVGKSAIFNRIVGRRLSIVHEEEGVTRDRVASEGSYHGETFELIDTGGLGMIDRERAPDVIENGIRTQVAAALEDAAVFILTVDVTAGVMPLDEEVARLLHASGRHVVVAANKADNPSVTEQADEFERLGFPVYPVAALHNLGFDELLEDVVKHLPVAVEESRIEPLRVAVVGKPNAGKSSYINRILRSDRLIVSDIPGTTRDSVEIPFSIGKGEGARHYQLIDTAGMRHVRRADTAVELFSVMRAKGSIERADIVVLVMDAVKGPSKQDKKIAAYAIEHRKGCVILVNKWDLAEGRVTQRAYFAALQEHVPFLSFAPVLFVSAQSGLNIRKSIDVIDKVAAAVSTNITTGTLNRVLHDAMSRVPPPASGNRRYKFYYATQTGVKPVRLQLFVNYPEMLPPSYLSYLENRIRDAFDLSGAPLVLQFKSSHQRRDGTRPPPRIPPGRETRGRKRSKPRRGPGRRGGKNR